MNILNLKNCDDKILMNILKDLILLLSFISNAYGFEMPPACTSKVEVSHCDSCSKSKKENINGLLEISEKILNPISNYQLFEKKAKELKAANIILKDKLASMFRSLRDGKKEPTYESGLKNVNAIEVDFKKLTELSKEANHLERKFNVCLNNCSASHKLEILDAIKKVQKLKTILLIGQPILANKSFEKKMSEMTDQFADNDQFFSRSQFEESLNSALFDNLQTILKKDSEYEHFIDDNDKPIFKNASLKEISDYNSNLITKFPIISEDIAKEFAINEVLNINENKSACFFVDKYFKYTKKKEYQELALDAGLFALPFALGPLGRVGEISVDLLFGERLAIWGLKGKAVLNATKVTDLTLQIAMAGNEASGIYEKYKKCQEAETSFLTSADANKLHELDICKKELSDRIFISELSSATLLTSTIAPKTISLLKSLTTSENSSKPKVFNLLLKDFGDGKNNAIRNEIKAMIDSTKKESKLLLGLSSEVKDTKVGLEAFSKKNNLIVDANKSTAISPDILKDYEAKIGNDTIELLYIPGSDVPFLHDSINKVGHVAIRIGNKVYHQTGGSGFKIETLDEFLNKTKKKHKVFGQVIQASEKEMKVMELYFQKMYDKQLPYSFLVNNCSQAVCKAMSLADLENVNPLIRHDPFFTQMQINRNERVVMRTLYNADKEGTEKELTKATINNRLAFYGVPMATGAAVGTIGYEAVDFVIEYLNQIKNNN